jgi:hypothetical protein
MVYTAGLVVAALLLIIGSFLVLGVAIQAEAQEVQEQRVVPGTKRREWGQ